MSISPINNDYIRTNMFDKSVMYQYNDFSVKLNDLSSDIFQTSLGRKKMEPDFDTKKEMEKLKQSKNLKMSPVSYIVPILDDYFSDKLSDDEFTQRIQTETRTAQFVFSKMPQNELLANQKIFAREFNLADKILITIYDGDNNIKPSIQSFVKGYNNNN